MSDAILIGYDGTDGSRAALTQGVALAKDLGAPLIVGFAYEPDRSGGEVADLRAALEEFGEHRLTEARDQASAAGVDAQTVLIDERPAEGLAEYAARGGVRMIVVGSYGTAPLRSAIVGSTPHKLLHLTDVPVLVVRAT